MHLTVFLLLPVNDLNISFGVMVITVIGYIISYNNSKITIIKEEFKMTQKFIKNIEFGKALNLASLVDYQVGRVVSLTLVQNDTVSLTLFAFSQGEAISTHSAPGDALVYILDGETQITIGGETVTARAGETVVMPANIPHGLEAVANFKMLLVVVK